MIGRNKRGIRRAATRVRLAVAAAVLVGGGAAGVVAVAATHGGSVSAQSAGYYTHYRHDGLSESHAMSDAMDWWHKSPQTSFSLINRMQSIRTVSMTSFHSHMIVVQRGTVAAAAPGEFVTRSLNDQLEVWHTTGGTKLFNVGGNQAGWNAMSGGTMSGYGSWNWSNASSGNWNMSARTLARGDLVFVFGEKAGSRLVAQLVLFAQPTQFTGTAAPVTMPATPAMTATPTMAAVPGATSPAGTSNGLTFSNNHS